MRKIVTIPKAVILGLLILILGRYIKLPPTKLQLGKFAYQLKDNKIYLEIRNNSNTPIDYRFDNDNDIHYYLEPGELKVLHEHILDDGQTVIEVYASVPTYEETFIKAINIKDVRGKAPENIRKQSEIPSLDDKTISSDDEEYDIEEDNDDASSDYE